MNNKILQLLLIPVFLLLALWVTNYVVTLPVFFQIYAGVVGVVLTVLVLVGRDLGFDFKFLCLLLLGYSFGGKGFAYITPVEPFFISEVTLVLCLFGLLFRYFRGSQFLPTAIHGAVFFWMVVVGVYLLVGFPEFGQVAIKDSAIGYYGLFFMISYAMFDKEPSVKAFGKVLVWMVFFGYIGGALFAAGIVSDLIGSVPLMEKLFFPQPDTFLPLISAGAIYGIMQGTSRRNVFLLGTGLVGILLLLLSKTAGIFCFGCCFMMMIIAARRAELLITSVAVGLLGGVVVAFLIVGESKFFEDKIMASDQVQTMTDISSASGDSNDSTSDWRISWWIIITEDTMANDPLFGSGMGSDISIHFLESVMNQNDSSNFPRYPHCILFTVLGRMGLVGLAFFLIFYGMMLRFSYVFVRTHFRGKELDPAALIAFGIFFGGLINSLIQATYEPPYAAITHWVCLGYLVSFHQRHKASVRAAAFVPFRQRMAQPLPA